MSRVIPSTLTLPTHDDHLPQDVVKKSKWNEILEALHYHYQRSGAIVPGLTFDDPWQTTSTSYVGANANGDVNLDTWCGIWKFLRPIINASGDTVYSMQFDAYIENCDLRFNWARYDSRDSFSTSVATGNVVLSSTSGDSEWIRETVEFTEAEAYESGSTSNDLALFYVYVEAKVPSSGTANIWHLGALEERISADALPGELEPETYVPFELTQDQFENQALKLALRAKDDQLWKAGSTTVDNVVRATDATWSDEDLVYKWIDAGPDGDHLRRVAAEEPSYETTPARFSQGIHFDGTDNHLKSPQGTKKYRFLNDDSTSWTVICRLEINEAFSNPGVIFTTRDTGSSRGVMFLYGASSGTIDWRFLVHDGASLDSVDHSPSPSADTLYTIAIRHTQGGVTEFFVDDLGSAAASGTLTTFSDGDHATDFNIGATDAPTVSANMTMLGLVMCAKKLTQAEMEAFETWITDAQS